MRRRPFLRAAGALSVATLATTAGCLSRADDEPGSIEDRDYSGYDDGTVAWPEEGFDAANTGYNPDAELLESDLESTKITTDGSGIRTDLGGSGVAVVEDRVYFGTGGGNVVCYGVDGKRRWSYEADPGAGVRTAPTVTRDVVYVSSENGSYALDAEDGDELWTSDAGIRWGSSVVADGRLYALSGRDGGALDLETGELDWSAETWARGAYAVADGILYAVGSIEGGEIAAFEDGEELWSRSDVGEFYAPPAVADDVVLACTKPGELYALDRDTGETVWVYERPHYATASTTPAVAHGQVYLPPGNSDWTRCLDLESGDELWTIRTSLYLSQPTAVADGVYFGTPNEGTFAVEPDGTIRWHDEDLRLSVPISAVGERLYAVPSVGPFGSGDVYLLEN
ncbi:outer membrane protein assembly factor BamB family protein [Natronobacterium texcoconense]|uniref:Outer membrane protein assembly factor BamB, contains PQQ-like beta-propeller repeat n=1 Tax=Natronobacterium texcoconense TaxID=1095778 RepID=A0A1H1GRK7_NATTX|nr:PQQ-binding-like beta-propeller repeat protein [Natronobacterium texcoconense]SDR15817.1 Outer membrane protein assembly factor BamB, contains PQQ-like beta-propeller repeat [Natronobacterium texcoconense]